MAVKKAKKAKTAKKQVGTKKVSRVKANTVKMGSSKLTRTQIIKMIADGTELKKAQVEAVFAMLNDMIHGSMSKRGAGEFSIPMAGIKVRRVKKKATKARKMISPLTGQEVTISAKPARSTIKVSALKALKAAAAE